MIARLLAALEEQRQRTETLLAETSRLSKFVHNATIGRTMEALKDELNPRRGQKIKHPKRPMALASRNSGLSIYEIAEKLRVPYSTAKSWGVKALPPDDKRTELSRSPYLVPVSAWKLK